MTSASPSTRINRGCSVRGSVGTPGTSSSCDGQRRSDVRIASWRAIHDVDWTLVRGV